MAFSLQDYKDLVKVGQGGMATVYQAVQKSLNRNVAIKKMATNFADNEILIKRFENEAKSAASLEHNNIIKIYDFGMDEGVFYISMEFIDGCDLDLLIKDRKFIREIGLMVALQAIKGLEFAHSRGVIHRDIKPGNILISKSGLVKVLDFGLASAGESVNLTSTDAVLGTPLFMSPEQARGEKDKDARIDIFSVGVLLYRILSGRFPFTGNNVPAVLYNIVHTAPQDIQELAPALPDELAVQIRLCMEKDKEKRLTGLRPLIDALENYFFEMGVRDTTREIARFMETNREGLEQIVQLLSKYHKTKGHSLADSGETEKAKAHLREALKYDSGDKETVNALSNLDKIAATNPLSRLSALGFGSSSGPGKDPQGRFSRRPIVNVLMVAIVITAGVVAFFIARPSAVKAPGVVKAKILPMDQRKDSLSRVNERKADSLPATAVSAETDVAGTGGNKTSVKKPVRTVLKGETRHPKDRAATFSRFQGTGFLHVFSSPWAELYIDDARIGHTPTATPLPLAAGTHKLALKREGFRNYQKMIRISGSDTVRLKITLKP